MSKSDDFNAEEQRVEGLQQRFPDLDFHDLDVALAVQRASVALDRSLAQIAKPHGLTPVALQALISIILHSNGPLNLATLGEDLRVTKANVSLVLASLENQKLIRRTADPEDGRKIRAAATKKGERVLAEIMPEALEAIHAAMEGLAERDRARLKQLARRVGS